MSDWNELKKLAAAASPGPWLQENDDLYFKDDGYTRHMMTTDSGHDVCDEDGNDDWHLDNLKFIAAANPAVVLALIAENDELKAVFEQPSSLNAKPADEYEVLRRQFFALRNYALCKDKLSGYYSRELEKLRCIDRSLSAGEIDAERDINEQLTNDLLAVETERDHLKAEIETLRKDSERYQWLRKTESWNLAEDHPEMTADIWIVESYEKVFNRSGDELDRAVDHFIAKDQQEAV